jgi:hypothetical protein
MKLFIAGLLFFTMVYPLLAQPAPATPAAPKMNNAIAIVGLVGIALFIGILYSVFGGDKKPRRPLED